MCVCVCVCDRETLPASSRVSPAESESEPASVNNTCKSSTTLVAAPFLIPDWASETTFTRSTILAHSVQVHVRSLHYLYTLYNTCTPSTSSSTILVGAHLLMPCRDYPVTDLIQTGTYDEYSCAMKLTTRLDHISHCKTASGTNWSNRWTYRVSTINTRPDQIIAIDAIYSARPTNPSSGQERRESDSERGDRERGVRERREIKKRLRTLGATGTCLSHRKCS